MTLPALPAAWRTALDAEFRQGYFARLARFVEKQRREATIYPPAAETFAALELTPPQRVRVVILGQDPYHDEGQANGLAFSVRPGTRLPPSLRNIFRELEADLGVSPPAHGSLEPWARQGVLLLNAVLTVRAHAAASHRKQGWERFTDRVIETVDAQRNAVVFVLWGNAAQQKRALIDTARHAIIASPHPSPLSAHRGFFGSRPFSTINRELQGAGHPVIDWQLPQPGE